MRSPKHDEWSDKTGPEAKTRFPIQDAKQDWKEDLVEEEGQGTKEHCSIDVEKKNM